MAVTSVPPPLTRDCTSTIPPTVTSPPTRMVAVCCMDSSESAIFCPALMTSAETDGSSNFAGAILALVDAPPRVLTITFPPMAVSVFKASKEAPALAVFFAMATFWPMLASLTERPPLEGLTSASLLTK